VCYVASVERVGVRELRQNLSVYLDRVKAGAELEVTEHGRPVARLAPLTARSSRIEQMIAEGRIRPALLPLHDLVVPPPPPDARMTGSEALELLREGER
jgi:prevent-host-death family protein